MSDNQNKVVGLVQWTLRNADGSVAREGEGKNLVVDNGRIFLYHQDNVNYPVGRYLFIADDDHDVTPDTNLLWASVGTGSNFENTRLDSGTGGWNRASLTRTVAGTFGAPSSQRRVTHIGLGLGTTHWATTTAPSGTQGQIFSALKVDPPIIQEVTQNLEVTYKVIVLPNTTKSLKRFPLTPGLDTERNFLEYILVDNASGDRSFAAVLLPYTFGKYHFIDGGASMLHGFGNNIHYRNNWNTGDGTPPSYGSRLAPTIPAYWYDGTTRLSASDNWWNAAFGMTVSGGPEYNSQIREASAFTSYNRRTMTGYQPLAHKWGKVGPLVFPHPIGRNFMFNETAIDKTGQGDLEIEGPYIPNDAGSGSPQHWEWRVHIMDSGDTDAGTEGTYVAGRLAWFSYPYRRQANLRTGGTGTYTYVANDGGSGNSAITQASGDFRHTDFFMPDSRLEISGTVSNDGTTYRIIKVEPLKLTLEGVVLTGEGPVASSIQAIDLVRPSGNADRFRPGSTGSAGWDTTYLRKERYNNTEGTDDSRCNHYRNVYDGIDSFWGLSYRNLQGDGSRYTLVRWRAMTGEQEFRGAPTPRNQGLGAGNDGNPLTDTTRFVKHADGSSIGLGSTQPYGLATDKQGLVFFQHRNVDESAGGNPVFIIDNSKPGRWYQRPSGSVTAGGVFTVDAADEIHAMFPFVSGDAGATPKIRIVNSSQGNDGVYPVATFNNANEVVLTGSFTAESNISWHWTTVDESQPAVGENRGLVYDEVNGRLWAFGTLGLKHSDDDGQTWSTLLDESTATTPLLDSEARTGLQLGSVSHGMGGMDVDPNGDIYWISVDTGGTNKYWINKLELNSGIGVDAVHSRINLTDNFPGANKPPSLSYLSWEKGVDNSNKLGALWFRSSDISATRYAWYRMTIDAGAISAAPQIAKIQSHNPNTFLDTDISTNFKHANHVIHLPSGKTYVGSAYTGNTGWLLWDPKFADDPDNAYWNYGEIIYDDIMSYYSSHGRQSFREDGCFWMTGYINTSYGYFGSFGQLHRYAPAADVGGQSGTSASIVVGAPTGQIRVQGLSGMTADSVGRHLEITAAASAANNNTFIIAAQNSASEVDVYAPNGVTGDAANGTIDWQEKESEWVQWEGSEDQFNAWYGTVSGGRRPMHADFRELRDNVKVKFTQAGGATAPVDEFVEGETFDFVASFGDHKTNVEDINWNAYLGYLPAEVLIENEGIKTADGPGGLVAYFQSNTSQTTPAPGVLEPTYRVSANGKDWGWEPNYYYMLYGNGLSPDTDPTDASTRPSWKAGLDLGSATEIHKLVVTVGYATSGFENTPTRVSQTSTDRLTEMRVYTAPDADTTTPTEVDATLRWPPETYALGKHIHVNQGGWHNYRGYAQYRFTIDLAGAGLSAGQRTARVWQVSAAHSASGNQAVILGSIYALDASDNPIGLTANHRIDEALDADFASMNIQQAFWIQNVHGNVDPGNGTVISTTDDGDGDGYTNTVTLDSGLFDTANIDITQDFLAWEEPGAPASAGYLRATDTPGLPGPRPLSGVTNADTTARPTNGPQAMSRIIDISTPGQIVVEDDMIPDNLSGAQWEVRRPMGLTTTHSNTSDDALSYDHGTGYLTQNPVNDGSGRRFRITNKTVFRK